MRSGESLPGMGSGAYRIEIKAQVLGSRGTAHPRAQEGGAWAAVETGPFPFVQTAFATPWVT